MRTNSAQEVSVSVERTLSETQDTPPVILELSDISIAVLNYTYGTNGISLPEDMPYAVDLLDEKQVAADIQKAEEMAEVTITRDDSGEVEIADYGVRPLVSHVASGQGGVTTYFLEDYSEELGEKNEITLQDADFSMQYCVDLCNSVWGDLWKD